MPARGFNVARNPYVLIEFVDHAVAGAGLNPGLLEAGGTDLRRLDRNMLTVKKLRISSASFAVRGG